MAKAVTKTGISKRLAKKLANAVYDIIIDNSANEGLSDLAYQLMEYAVGENVTEDFAKIKFTYKIKEH